MPYSPLAPARRSHWTGHLSTEEFAIGPDDAAGAGDQLRIDLFVRCGDRFTPPHGEAGWQVLTLPAQLRGEDLLGAVRQVRNALRGHRAARLLVAGPVALGIALGQALAHEPIAIDYVQLDQTTKRFEVWVTNREQL